MPRKTNINLPFSGMSRETFPHQTDEKTFTFQKNGNLDTDENSVALTNEHSTLLCSRFKPNFKVIGSKVDILNNTTYFFLVNPLTGCSEIGQIKHSIPITSLEDIEQDCNCQHTQNFNTPLEEQIQAATCTYTTIFQECCDVPCLNFSLDNPIFDIVLKQEAVGQTLYWTDGLNPPRHLELDNLEQYFENDLGCGETEALECPDCEKLRIFNRAIKPCIIPVTIVNGGSLRNGNYEFAVAYCDQQGNELSSYMSFTNPVHIFDENNIVLQQPTLNALSHFGIRLNIEGLDKRYNFYKVVVIERSTVQGAFEPFILSIEPIENNTILFVSNSDLQQRQRIDINLLSTTKPTYSTFNGMATSGDLLLGYGIKTEEEWNLQPIVNLMGEFVKWQTVITHEELYKDGVNDALYRGYMRDEVYPLGIRFVSKSGYTTRIFHLPGRVQTDAPNNIFGIDETDDANPSDKSVESILGMGSCEEGTRTKNWQFFNTATKEPGFCPNNSDLPTELIEQETNFFCEVQEDGSPEITYTPSIPSFNLQDVEGFDNLEEYIRNVLSNPCATDPDEPVDPNSDCLAKRNNVDNPLFSVFQDILNNINSFNCTMPTDESLDAEECEDWEFVGANIEILEVVGEETVKTSECDATEYDIPSRNTICDTYQKEMNADNSGNQPVYDTSTFIGIAKQLAEANGQVFQGPKVYKRTEAANLTCAEATLIPSSNYSQFLGQVFQYKIVEHVDGDDNEKQLQTSILAKVQSGNWTPAMEASWTAANTNDIYFTDKIHKNASWFKYSFEPDKDEIVLRILPKGSCSDCNSSLYADNLENESTDLYYRYHIMSSCSQHYEGPICNDNPSILASGIVNRQQALEGIFLGVFSKIDFPKGDIYVVIDSPIHFKSNDLSFYTFTDVVTQFNLPILGDCHFICSNPHVTHGVLRDCDRVGHDYTCHYSANVSGTKTASAITPADGCYMVSAQSVIYESVLTSFDYLVYTADKEYQTTCTYEIPVVNTGCTPIPYEKGRMAFWESTVKYPNNHHLFDSSNLLISATDIPLEYRPLFEEAFVTTSMVDSPYLLNEETTNLCDNAYIRHHKMPDNRITSFTSTTFNSQDNLAVVFPLGIHIDAEIIRALLDIAVKTENGLITQDQLDNITHYEILRGDRTLHKSVLFKGYAFDMYRDNSDRFFGKTVLFKNFPFNTLGSNKLLTNTFGGNSNDYLQHPDNTNYANKSYSVVAPEIYLDKSTLGTEVNIEGYMFGKTSTSFDYVDRHSRWVILSPTAYRTASNLATMEVILENITKVSELAVQASNGMWITVGTSSGTGVIGYVVAIVSIAAFIVTMAINTVTNYIRYKTQWLENFKNLGTPINFAKYSVGKKGFYNYFRKELDIEESLRGIGTSLYLKPGKPTFFDKGRHEQVTVNNRDREDSYYVSFSEHPLTPDTYYSAYDNADKNNSKASRHNVLNCATDYYTNKNVASPYFSIKNYLPAQYGELGTISYLNTNKCLLLNNTNKCDPIFGGDTYITRTSFKNKFPLFHNNAFDIADRTPFDYTLYPNVAWPFYFCQYDFNEFEEKSAFGYTIPYATVHSNYRFKCSTENKHYIVQPSHFYLFSYGIPYILTESTLNTNYRYAGFEKHEKFAGSNSVDEEEWTQEKVVSIQMNNVFKYNQTYSESQFLSSRDVLPYNVYSPDYFKTLADNPNGVVYSSIDVAERSITDPFLTFRANDIKTYKARYGRLISINTIESSVVLLRFENQCVVLNTVDVLKDRVTPQSKEVGMGGVFAQNSGRDVTFMETPLGETGTQHRAFVSTPFGHYWVDAKRGKINKVESNGTGLTQISHFKSGGKGISGMGKWFQKHLPFNILKKDFPGRDDVNIDNAFKDIGIVMWWDNKFNRLFITKKDYILKSDCIKFDAVIGFYDDCTGSCPDGYTYNSLTDLCEKVTLSGPICPVGYTYDLDTQTCTLNEESDAICGESFKIVGTGANNTFDNVIVRCFENTIITINWGDGNFSSNLAGTSELVAYHTYLTPYTGDIIISLDTNLSNVSDFHFQSNDQLSMDTFEIAKLTQLSQITIDTVTGLISELPTSLIIFSSGLYSSTTISGDLSELPPNMAKFILVGQSSLTNITGDISDIPLSMEEFRVRGGNAITGDLIGISTNTSLEWLDVLGTNTISGDINNLPVNLTNINISGSNTVSGDISNLPITTVDITISGFSTITGDISTLPVTLTDIVFLGNNTVFGNIFNLPLLSTRIFIIGLNTISDYTSGRAWATGMRNVYITPISSGLSSSEVDNLLIDLASTTWIPSGTLVLTGTNAPRTATSDTAVTTLTGIPVTVTTN